LLAQPLKFAFGDRQTFLQSFRDPYCGNGVNQVADFTFDLDAPRGESVFPLLILRFRGIRKFLHESLDLRNSRGGEKLCLDHAQQSIIDILTTGSDAYANACTAVLTRYASVGALTHGYDCPPAATTM
jgi:hypothetical protein